MSKSKKIIAIGGGSILDGATLNIDKEIINLTGIKSPTLLFIPTASSDSEDYINRIKKHFGKRLKCKVKVLCLIKENLSKDQIRKMILNTDIIYVGGGNTLMMVNKWKKLGVDKFLKLAYTKGKVLCGLSAGSICWFKSGNSDSKQFTSKDSKKKKVLIKVSGIGLINALNCPHYDSESYRQKSLKIMMKKTKGVAIAVEDSCAIEIIDNKYRVITSKHNKKAYKIYWHKKSFYKEVIEQNKEFKSLNQLLKITKMS